MTEYLINVALGMIAPTFAAVIAFFIGVVFRNQLRKLNKAAYGWFVKGIGITYVLLLIIVATGTSITYKHEPFDKVQEQKVIEMYNEAESNRPVVIRDTTKPIEANTREEFEKLVDYSEK